MEALIAKMDAWDQVVAFFGLLIFAWWISVFPHCDDGVEEPERQRLHVIRGHAARIDPGIWLATSGRLSWHDPATQEIPRQGEWL